MTDRELLARIAASAGQKAGYKQLVRELSLRPAGASAVCCSSNSPGSPSAASSSNSIASTGAFPALRPACGARQSRCRPPRSASRRLRLCPPQSQTLRQAIQRSPRPGRTSSFRPAKSTPPCRATRFWSSSTLPKPMAASRAASCEFSSAATPPSSARFACARADRGRNNVVIPFDDRMTQPIVIPPGAEIPAAAGSSTPHRVLGREAKAPSKTRKRGAPERRAWRASSSTSRSPVGPRPRDLPSAASLKSSARLTILASTWR